MPAPQHVLIPAAGLGSRLGHGAPKTLITLGGRSLLEHQLRATAAIEDVRIVVGYCEQEVMSAARAVRSDVLFVRNPNFRQTTTLQSLSRAASGLSDAKVLIMDADTLFRPVDFDAFVAASADVEALLGVSARFSEQPVYAHTDGSGAVTSFHRERPSGLEWASLAAVPASWLTDQPMAVFEALTPHLPLPAFTVDRLEVDTERDLQTARAWLDAHPEFLRDV